jgi:hypothetical protein
MAHFQSLLRASVGHQGDSAADGDGEASGPVQL